MRDAQLSLQLLQTLGIREMYVYISQMRTFILRLKKHTISHTGYVRGRSRNYLLHLKSAGSAREWSLTL